MKHVSLDANHKYTYKSCPLPGVTYILEPASDFSMIDPIVLANKASLGTAVHACCEYWDKGTLDMDSVSDNAMPYLQAWLKFRKDTDFVVKLNEHIVFSKFPFYAGTLDRVGTLNGTLCVLDIKCVAQLTPQTGMQLAAYQQAENSNRLKGEQIEKRFAVQLKPDGHYLLREYKGALDFTAFTAWLTINEWNNKNGIKRHHG